MTTCETCRCPLTILKTLMGRPEVRTKCVRCSSDEIAGWKPEVKLRVVEGGALKGPKTKAKRASLH